RSKTGRGLSALLGGARSIRRILPAGPPGGLQDVVLIGSMMRPAIWQIRPDLKTLRLLPRIFGMFRGGGDYLLKGVAAIFAEHGFRLLGAHAVAPEILMPEGALGRDRPTERDNADIAKGLAFLTAASPFDVGQAV